VTTTATQTASVIHLHPWQKRLVADEARVIAMNWHRQAGKDFGAGALMVRHSFESGQPWYISSLTQRQANQSHDKCQLIADVYRHVLKRMGPITESQEEYEEYDKGIDHMFRRVARTLHLPGGGTVTSLPGRSPDTLAGLTGNVSLTEFGLYPNGGYEHWRVIFPFLTRGYRILLPSTPRGRNHKYYEICSDPDTYSVHFQPITRSIEEGFELHDNKGQPTDLETFKRLYNDAAGWTREYMCEFTGDQEALVKWSQLAAAGIAAEGEPFESLRIVDGNGWDASFWSDLVCLRGRVEIGWDVARHSDLAVMWVNAQASDKFRYLRKLVICQRTSFALQRTIIRSLMDANPRAVGCGDATGLGMDSNETLAGLYGARWLPVTFTAKSKRELASGLMTAFDDVAQGLPAIDGPHKYVAVDIYSLQKEGTKDTLKIYETPNPIEEDSHCDIAWAGALAIRAGNIAGTTAYLSVA
jgi:phage FluMu gp28-like protein